MLNKVHLIGRLGQDPELRRTAQDKAVCNFTMATGRKGKDGVDQTEWHRVVCWEKTAENVHQFLKKGRQIYVEGEIRSKKWTDKQGVEKNSTEIWASTVHFLGDKPVAGSPEPKDPSDDIPF